MRNDTDLGPSAVASFVRGELARALRSRHPYTVNLLLGGHDPITKQPHLYWIDYLASLVSVPYAAHGYAQYVENLLSLAFDDSEVPNGTQVILTTAIGITASQSLISIIIQTSTLKRVSRFYECVQTNSSEGYL